MKRTLSWALILALALALSGCLPKENEPSFEPDDPVVETVPHPTLPLPQNPQASDVLRVATRGDVDLNPLWPKHYATASLLRLVHLPLFDLDYDGHLVPVLVRHVQMSSDERQYTIVLKDDIEFHNGRAITAEDALASLKTYMRIRLAFDFDLSEEEDQETPVETLSFKGVHSAVLTHQYRSLSNIKTIESRGAHEVIITLEAPDPDLVRLLIIPVLPADEVNTRSLNPLTGSGSWQIASSSIIGISLVRLETGGHVRRIEASAYSSILEASRAFDAGDIDLLLMDEEETTLYADRSRIRKQRFDDDGYISLVFPYPSIDNRDLLLYAIESDPGVDFVAAPMSRLSYPVLPTDVRLIGARIRSLKTDAPEGITEEIQDEAGKPEASDRRPFRLIVPELGTPNRLIDKIEAALARVDRQLIVEHVSVDEWQRVLNRRDYDAALILDESISYLDPVDYLEGLYDVGLWNWRDFIDPDDQEILVAARRKMDPESRIQKPTPAEYAEAIYRVFEKTPAIGLAATSVMVWYSDNIEGTMSGTRYSPYEGVEDLQIWRR